MKKIIATIVFATIYVHAFCQERGVDSVLLRKSEELHKQALALTSNEDYNAAIAYADSSIRIRKEAIGADDSVCANIMYLMSDLYFDSGKYLKALYWAKQCMQIRSKILTEKSPDYFESLFQVGKCNCWLGKWNTAKKYFDNAIEGWSETQDTISRVYLKYMEFRALVSRATSEYLTAIGFLIRAENIATIVYGEESEEVGDIMAKEADYCLLATGFSRGGDCSPCLEVAEQSLFIHKKINGGKVDYEYYDRLCTVANIYMSMGEYKKADSIYSDIYMASNDTVLIPRNDALSHDVINNYAQCLHREGYYYKAIKLYLKLLTNLNHEDNEEQKSFKLSVLKNIVNCYIDLGDVDNSLNYIQQAYDVVESMQGMQFQNNKTSLAILKARIFSKNKEYGKAIQTIREAIE